MRYRILGSTGFRVSEIGFGGWGIGGRAYGTTDDEESLRALNRAFDLGITFYDTADLYGEGRSEELIGKALHHVRNNVVIATKVGYIGSDSRGDTKQDFSSTHIRKAVDASLQRLNTSYIDMYLLHSPPREVFRRDEVLHVLDDLRTNGKIRSYGVSLRAVDDGHLALDCGVYQVVQVIYNLVDQRAAHSGLIDQCQHSHIGVVARVPLAFGFLTGKYRNDHLFAEGDQRTRWTVQQREEWIKGARCYGFLNRNGAQTMAQAALSFCLAYPGVSTVIPGMKTTVQVEENASTCDFLPLTTEELQQVERVYPCYPY